MRKMRPIYYIIMSVIAMSTSSLHAGVILRKKTMTYDIFNRQTSSTLSKPNGNGGWIVEKSESSTYRGDKWHRASTTLISPITQPYTTNYLYDGDNVIADIVNGQVAKSYVTPTLDSPASITDHSSSTTYYFNQDERQSVKNLTDSAGGAVQSYDYTAYGDKVDSLTSGSVEQRYTYTGRELNETSGNYYFRYRIYGAGIGGFLSRDPRNYIEGLSLYSSYFGMRMTSDPYGLFSWDNPSRSQLPVPPKAPSLGNISPCGFFGVTRAVIPSDSTGVSSIARTNTLKNFSYDLTSCCFKGNPSDGHPEEKGWMLDNMDNRCGFSFTVHPKVDLNRKTETMTLWQHEMIHAENNAKAFRAIDRKYEQWSFCIPRRCHGHRMDLLIYYQNYYEALEDELNAYLHSYDYPPEYQERFGTKEQAYYQQKAKEAKAMINHTRRMLENCMVVPGPFDD